MIRGQADVLALLSRRDAIRLDRACPAVLLAGHVLINAVPVVKPAPVQDLALRTRQMMTPVVEAAGGIHVGFLQGMDGNGSRYIPVLEELPQLTRVVAYVSRQRHRLER